MRKLSNLTLVLCGVILFVGTSCGDDAETFYLPGEEQGQESVQATVEIALAEIPESETAKILFTPSENASKFEFAIGGEGDKYAFDNGTMQGIISTEGHESTEHIFSSLDEASVYYIFAKAYIEEEMGPTTTFVLRTFAGGLVIEEQFVSFGSLAFHIDGYRDYTTIDYWLVTEVTEAVITDFEDENYYADRKISQEDIFRKFTATYFDLEPETEYYLLYRAKDRFGNWTRTFTYDVSTASVDDVPAVIVNKGSIADFYVTELQCSSNANTGQYFIVSAERGALEPDGYSMGMANYAGDYLGYIISSYNNRMDDVNLHTSSTSLSYINNYLLPEVGYEIYILLFDDATPVAVNRYSWATPDYDSSAGTASVAISVTPTENGGNYIFNPNSDTIAFLCETFTAELIDGNDIYDPGAKDDQWITDYFVNVAAYYPMLYSGTQWQYRNITESWPLTWDDASGGSYATDTEFIIATLPLNKNGLAGLGELTKVRYTKL